MQVLFEGIYSKFTGSTGAGTPYVLLGGRLHPNEAPQNSSYPYGVYSLISDVPSYVFNETGAIEEAVIQFDLYDDDNSAVDICTAYTAMCELYDYCDLSVTGYTNVFMKREYSFLERGEELWDYMIQYRVMFQKN